MKYYCDLQCNGLVLAQDKDAYNFTTDAVLLANFVKTKKTDIMVELCAGTGVISTLVMEKQFPKQIFAVEIQKECCELFDESKKINNQNNITVLNMPLQKLSEVLSAGSADVVVVNPPYYKQDQAKNSNPAIALSTHEVAVTIKEVFSETSRLLKFGGAFYLVHHVDRFAELVAGMKDCGLEPKIVRFVQPKAGKDANLVLIKAVKGGKPGLKVKNVLIFRDDNNEESLEVKQIYGRLQNSAE